MWPIAMILTKVHRAAVSLAEGGQSGTAVTHPLGNHQDVGSNPATARKRKKKGLSADPSTEDAPIVWQDLSGRPAM